MAQPPAYAPAIGFSIEEAANVGGRSTLRTAALDIELANLATTIAAIRANLALLQRDDTKLADGLVDTHTLSSAAKLLISSGSWTPRGNWATATAYAYKDLVEQSGSSYVCLVAHTSGNFTTDRAAGNWLLVSSSTTIAANIGSDPVGGIAATNVQAALAEIDREHGAIVQRFNHLTYGGL